MTLLELATFVCGKVNQTETEDLAACKGFLQRRFNLLWSSDLWKDAIVSYTQTLSPTGYTLASTWLPTKAILLVPPIIERVLAVRSDTRHLNVQRPEFYYRVDLDVFAKTGLPTEFLVLPPCVWEWDQDAVVSLQENAADAAVVLTIDTLDSDLIGVTRQSLTAVNGSALAGTTQRIDALLKAATVAPVVLSAAGSGTITLTNAWNAQAAILMGPDAALLAPDQNYLLNPGQSVQVQPDSYIGQQLAAVVAIPGGAGFRGTITITSLNTYTFASSALTVLSVPAADTAAKIRQRIRLVQIPDSSLTIRVLGKRSAPQFTSDLDSPGLTGVENALLAFAQGDMLQRERHYAKAQSLYQEGALLLAALKQQEAVQQAHEQRIIPEQGYGSEEWNRLYGFSF